MGKIIRQTVSEIKQLPLLLGKLLGGIMAAIGFPGAILVAARRANPTLPDILPYIVAGVAGIVIFTASSRALAKRFGNYGNEPLSMKEKKRISFMAWIILLLLATVFLLCTYFMTRR